MTYTCKQCGAGYIPKRSTAQFCSPSCRVAFNRRTEELEQVSVTREPVSVTESLSVTEPVVTLKLHEQNCLERGVNTCNTGGYLSRPELPKLTKTSQKATLVNRVPLPGDLDYKGVYVDPS